MTVESRSVGEALKDTQTGKLPIGTVDGILEAAPKDIVETTLEVPEWDCSVRVRSLTAAQEAQVKQKGLEFRGETTKVWFAEMELTQFQASVVEPKFKLDDARRLQHTSSKGWQRIVAWIDKQSSLDKEEVAKLKDDFPAMENGSSSGVDDSEGPGKDQD